MQSQRHSICTQSQSIAVRVIATHAIAALLFAMLSLPVAAQVLSPLNSSGSMGLGTPNGDFTVAVDDLVVKVPGGYARVNRDFGGTEWQFNRQWSGLGSPEVYTPHYASIGDYYTCTIIDGVNSCDTTAQSGQTVVLPPPPERIYETRILNDPTIAFDENGHPRTIDNPPDLLVRKGVVFTRGSDGVSFTNSKFPRFVIRPQMVPVLPLSSGPDSQPSVGKPGQGGLPTTMINGYRWTDRSGEWIEYDNFGRISSYGDRNNVRVWMQNGVNGNVERVLDDNGRTIFTFLYSSDKFFLIEARDHTPTDGSIRRVQYQYDNIGRMVAVIDALGQTTRFEYGVPGTTGAITSTASTLLKLKKITDVDARVTNVDYDVTARVSKITAPDGGATEYLYGYDKLRKEFSVIISSPQTASGRRSEVRNFDIEGHVVFKASGGKILLTASGSRASMSYTNERAETVTVNRDNFDMLTSKVFADGSSVNLTYESGSLDLKNFVDESGAVVQLTHDNKGNLLTLTSAVGTPEQQVTQYTVNARGETEHARRVGGTLDNGSSDPDVNLLLSYDAVGNISQLTDGEGKVWQYQYDAMGNLTQSQDPLGHTWKYTYDAQGRRLSETDPNQHSTTYGYDHSGHLLTITDPRGKVERLEYDVAGRLQKRTDSTGASVTVTYDAAGHLVSAVDSLNHHAQFDYDNLDRTTSVIDGEGNATGLDYTETDGTDHGSALVSKVNFPTLQTLLRYNSRHGLTQVADVVDGQTRSHTATYDPRGVVTGSSNAYDKTQAASYDALGRTTEGTDELGHHVQFGYDHRNNLVSATDALGHTTRFAYDRNDHLLQETNAVGQTTRYSYDAAGRLQEMQNANGTKLEFNFDAGGRLSQRQALRADNSVELTDGFTWDNGNRLTGWATSNASSASTFDDAGRLLSETVTIAGVAMTRHYTYYANGQVQSFTGPDGVTVGYVYDGNGNLSRLDLPGEGVISVTGRKWTEPTQVVLPGGTSQTTDRDGALEPTRLRVTTPAQASAFDQQNVYGLEGELTQRTTQGQRIDYGYDDSLRLTQADPVSGTTETFALDSANNRTSDNVVSGPWQYDAANRLTQRGNVSYAYDAAGNLIRKVDAGQSEPKRTTNYSYDSYNRLVEVRDGADATIARYSYDPFGYRLSKEVTGTGASQTGAPAGTRYYFQGEEGVLAEVNTDGSVRQSYGWQPERTYGTSPLFLHAGNAYFYYHNDLLGQPRLLTDHVGQVVWEASRISAFGEVTVASGATVDQPWRLPGQYFDQETGLHYNLHRYFDTTTGRYISQDPIGIFGGLNFYTYVGASPLRSIDPSGLSSVGYCAHFGFGLCVTNYYVNGHRLATDVKFGIGLGGGLKVNPFGKPPNENVKCAADSLGIYGGAHAGFGPFSVGGDVSGGDLRDRRTGKVYYGDEGPSLSDALDFDWKWVRKQIWKHLTDQETEWDLDADFSGGIEYTEYEDQFDCPCKWE